jgi:uncharacterized cupredoxin-like copper-binding protein
MSPMDWVGQRTMLTLKMTSKGRKQMKQGLVCSVALGLVSGVIATGCGDSDSATTEAQSTGASTGTTAPAGGAVEIKMGDYFFDPKDATAEAGSVAISAPNEGKVEHELMLLKTNTDPAKLPTASDGGVEEKLHMVAEENGEIADVEPGDTKSVTFDLTPGKWVMFCNLPGHYAQGMYGSLTVTK